MVHRQRLDAAGELVTSGKDIRHGCALAELVERRLVRPDRRALVAVEDVPRAAGVPEDGEQDRGRPVLVDVAVQRGPERRLVFRGHERVEQHERAVLDERVRGDVPRPTLAVREVLGPPVGMRRGPPPEVRRDLLDLHGHNVPLRDGAARAARAVRLRADDRALPRVRARPREPLGRRRAPPGRRRSRAADRGGAGRGGGRAARRRDAAGRAGAARGAVRARRLLRLGPGRPGAARADRGSCPASGRRSRRTRSSRSSPRSPPSRSRSSRRSRSATG